MGSPSDILCAFGFAIFFLSCLACLLAILISCSATLSSFATRRLLSEDESDWSESDCSDSGSSDSDSSEEDSEDDLDSSEDDLDWEAVSDCDRDSDCDCDSDRVGSVWAVGGGVRTGGAAGFWAG